MSDARHDDTADLDDVIDPREDALPDPIHQGHAGQPERLDDDALAAATEQERVAAGVADYAPDRTPPATNPLPDEASEAADRAQRGLDEDTE